jgi:hypothetical protein
MLRKTAIVVAAAGLAIASPAFAGNHGHSSSSGWTGSTSGWTNSSTSGGHTGSTSGNGSTSGTQVPEPGMLGLAGLGLIGLGAIRMRRRRA